jgi:uncharacterized RDD family membrane protein YckC
VTTLRERAAPHLGRRAGIVSRISANALDLVVVFVIYFAALITFAGVRFIATPKPLSMPHPPNWVSAIVLVAIEIFYLALGWSGERVTFGKGLVGLRVLSDHGQPISFWRGLVRAVVCTIIGGPLLLWAAVSKRNAALYDYPLKTAVVYEWRGR